MKKVKLIFGVVALAALLAVTFIGCDDEETKDPPDASFSFVATGNGMTIEFTNESTNATTYLWDFGDGNTSTEENPTHTFPDFGDFLISLTATGEGGSNTFTYTITVTKTSPIKLDDNSTADWATVADAFVSVDNNGGLIQKVKVDYDGEFIYFYMEVTDNLTDSLPTGIHFDLDNDTTTGFWPWTNTGIGGEMYIEAGITCGSWFSAFDWNYTTATQNDWAWNEKAITDYILFGYHEQVGSIVKTEWAVRKLKLDGTTKNGAVTLGDKVTIIINHYLAWEPAGFFPGQGEAAFVLNM
jgi:PKD repeat protein